MPICRLFVFVNLFALGAAALAQNPQVSIQVDAQANRHAISPYIYGTAYASTSELQDLNFKLHRYGGNNTTRYNWQLNADNRGSDWYFQSIGDASSTAAERTDNFIAQSRAGGAEPMITIPMVDWVAKLGAGRGKLASFSQAKYGEQTDADWSWMPDAGNGILAATGLRITGNDPNDANMPNDVAKQQSFVQHTLGQWGSAANGGLRYYILDNEHSIWFETHRDVAPVGATMEQIRDKMIAYGAMIRNADPGAKIVGPEEFGWSGYLLSGYDIQYGNTHGWGYLPDRAAHGNADYMPWLLGQLRQHEQSTGQRVLDVFSLHYYPQQGEFSDTVSSSMQLLRNRSTRSLWDPSYVDTSWIGDIVKLIPRMKDWVATYYPGLPTAITEYNWGAENHINGATTQADILGIFGREGLDYAARWTTPASSTPTYKAMKMYRNYDGSQGSFGETSVLATVPNADQLSAFAAQRSSDGALTLMVINKVLSGNTPIQVNLANFPAAGGVKVWQLTSSNTISQLADLTLSGNTLSATVPPQSVTLFVLAAAIKVQRAYVSASAGSDGNMGTGCAKNTPCRTLATAAGVVQSGGELVALDNGEYGAVTVADSMSLIGAPGATVAIDVATGNGITIAAANARVALRNLRLVGKGGVNGIAMSAGSRLDVEDCVIRGFNAGSAVVVNTAARVLLSRSSLQANGNGLVLDSGAQAMVEASRFTHHSGNAIWVSGTAASTTQAAVNKSSFAGDGAGTAVRVEASAAGAVARAWMNRSSVSNNLVGLAAVTSSGGSATLTAHRNQITHNSTGLLQSGTGAAVRSRGDNSLTGNSVDVSGTVFPVLPM